ncbi:uncharacterized protein LOC125582228 [Brassica napus]|uniref:uncharacterized protein LOC125582228 n=1 Tax=Brassica napus TaxID=3708 RepID=UPI002078FEDC|nr:uncharacterized protein LOC125582228 [Brassica napus]
MGPCGEELEEIEEGEVVKGWLNATPGKTSKSPKTKSLEYGQVKIATRFSALVDVDDNGNLRDQEEGMDKGVVEGSTGFEITEVNEATDVNVTEVAEVTEAVEVTEVNEVTEVFKATEVLEDATEVLEDDNTKATEDTDSNGRVVVEDMKKKTDAHTEPRTAERISFADKVKQGMIAENSGASNKGLQFGALLETRVKESKSERIVSSVFKGWSFVNNYEFNRKGRIWVLWSPQMRVTPVFKSDQMITVSVLAEGETEEFLCSFVYAENTIERRKELWDDIKAHQNSPMFRNKEWIIMGDFNDILEEDEHSNHQVAGLSTPGMRDFEEVIQYCSLTDMGYQGPKFTWCNKREEGIICKKLDRILVNETWLNQRTQAYGVFEAGGCSDHLRGRFHLKPEATGKQKPFKFTNALAEMPELLAVVKDYWKDTQPLFVSTSALYRFSKSLKALKPLIRHLSKAKLGELSRKVKEAYQELRDKQEKVLNDPSQDTTRAELVAAERWQRISAIEEKLL